MSQVQVTPNRGLFQDNESSASNTSILEVLKTIQDSGDLEQSIYSEWESLLEKMDFTVTSRNTNDEWFKTCYLYCEKKKEEIEHEASTVDEQKLYGEFENRLTIQIEREQDFVVQLKLKEQLSKLQLQSQTPEVWIRRAHQCVVEETKLIENYLQICTEMVTAKEPCEHLYNRLKNKEKDLNGKLEITETRVKNFRTSKENYLGLAEQIQSVQDLVDAQGGMKNGIQSLFQQGNTLAENAREDVDQNIQEFWTAVQALQPIFEEVYGESKILIERLIEEVKLWQNEFKLKYAELYGDADLNRIAPWCAKTGEMLQNILTSYIPRLETAISDVIGSEHSQCSQMYTQFFALRTSFYRRSPLNNFLAHITKSKLENPSETDSIKSQISSETSRGKSTKRHQQRHNQRQPGPLSLPSKVTGNVKKSKTRPLSVKLRILGADSYAGLGGTEVHALFVQETHIKDCFHRESGCLDINRLKEKSLKFKSGQRTKFVRHSTTTEGRFSNIELCLNMARTKALPVFEEKYRLIFYTQLEKEIYWFDIPVTALEDLQLSSVAEMLQRKIRNLTSHRSMTEDNIQHLKEKLLGTLGSAHAETKDDTKISLHHFCNTPLERPTSDRHYSKCAAKVGFTFWEWFLSIYNLIGLPCVDAFWKKGWLDGFLSKKMAEKKLMESTNHKPGTFLLRFSDWHIRHSQGKDAVFGMIAPTLLFINNGIKAVDHMELIGYDQLKELPLANILLNTKDSKGCQLYSSLYPEVDSSCEQLLKEYTLLGPTIPGYTGLTKAFIANLEKVEQEFIKLELRGKRTKPCSPETGPKKAKGVLTATVPSIQPEPRSLATTNIQKELPAESEPIYCGVPIVMIPCKTGSSCISHKNITGMPCKTYVEGKQSSVPVTLLPTVIRDSYDIVNQNNFSIKTKTAEVANSQTQNFSGTGRAIPNYSYVGKDSSDLYKTISASMTRDRQQNQSEVTLLQEQCFTGRVNLSTLNVNKFHLPLRPSLQLQNDSYTHNQVPDNIEADNGGTLGLTSGEYYYPSIETSNTVRENEKSCSPRVSQTVGEKRQRPSDASTTLRMIKNYLEDLPSEALMTVLPLDKMTEMMTPCLHVLPPESRQKVMQALQVNVTRMQSSSDNRLNQRDLTAEEIPESDPSGLNLRTSEIEAGLSMTEDELHPIAENIGTFDFQDTIDELNIDSF